MYTFEKSSSNFRAPFSVAFGRPVPTRGAQDFESGFFFFSNFKFQLYQECLFHLGQATQSLSILNFLLYKIGVTIKLASLYYYEKKMKGQI